MRNTALIGSAAAALVVATGSLLAPQAASALDFTFFFVSDDNKSVSGIIRGLENNATVAPLSIEVTSSSLIGTQGLYSYLRGLGFTVADGVITDYEWIGVRASTDFISFISFSSSRLGADFQQTTDGESVVDRTACLNVVQRSTRCPVVFAPSASVPGPLTWLGAAAAFGFSRRLRYRITRSSNTTWVAPLA